MTRLLFCLSLLLCSLVPKAQKYREVLQRLKDSFPQERIHMHFDKDIYLTGETIWFKAYLFSGSLPSDLSANFIVELIDNSQRIVQYKKLPIISGTAMGNFETGDSLKSGPYLVRAYTPWMLNFDEGFVYRKPLVIYSGTGNLKPEGVSSSNQFSLFPEGGDLVAGTVNVVAFKANDAQGWPKSVSGKLTDDAGNEITSFASVHDGMGSFGFLPETGKQYKTMVRFEDGSEKTYELPVIKENGWILQAREESAQRRRLIIAKAGNVADEQVTIIGQMHHELLFEQNVKLQGNNAILVLDTKDFPSGIMQLTLLTNTGRPLAERLLFINNEEYRLPATLQLDTVSLARRARNVLSFNIPDSLTGSFSVAVIDESRMSKSENEEHILSRLLLTGDLKGYVHHPGFYLKDKEKPTRTAADLLMMTQGWRRFSWGDVLLNKFPVLRFRDQNYIQLSGSILSSATRKPVTDGEINFILRTRDSLTDFFQAPVAPNGKFFLDNLVFADTAQFSFQLNSKKNKEKQLYIELDKDSVDFQRSGAALLAATGYTMPIRFTPIDASKNPFAFDITGNYKVLETVAVTAKKKRPLEELNDRYTHGLFSSLNMVRILDLVNNEPGAGALNVFQYIQGRIGGLRVVPSNSIPPSYTIYTGRAMSLTGGPIPVPLFLDEAPATAAQLMSIPMNQIAMIKYFQTGFMGNPGSGSTQALAVYSKKNADYKRDLRGYLNAFAYPGYSVVREFYAPDYDQPVGANIPDRRATLLWMPEVKIDPETLKYKVRFFNNDSSKKIRVVLEGVTADGKIVHEEKILE